MNWDSKSIRKLRLSMGWTQCDLSRRLQTDMAVVAQWERNETVPDKKFAEQLTLIAKQAEFSADVLSQAPLAELYLDESELDQCEIASLKDKMIEK